MFSALSHWWQRRSRSGPSSRPSRCSRGGVRPRLEALEDRCVPSTTWFVTNNADNINQVGTLRYAVAHAHDGDVVEILPSATHKGGLQVALTLTQGELFLDHNITIEGVGPEGFRPAIAGGRSRIFEISPRASVTLDNLFLEGGNGVANNPLGNASLNGDGGAILNEGTLSIKDNCVIGFNKHVHAGGGIYNVNTLIVTNSTVEDNSAFAGGGIYNKGGVVVMTRIDMQDNSATGGGGAILNEGGVVGIGINSVLRFNHALNGGAIANYAGQTVLGDSTLEGNTAARDGGALANVLGKMQVFHCLVENNKAGLEGGGIFSASADLSVTAGCTLTDNHAGLDGGAITIESGTAVVSDTLLSVNTAKTGGAISLEHGTLNVTHCIVGDNFAMFGGGIFNSQGTLQVETTLFTANTPDHIKGQWTDLGGNTFM
jgi:hypothetical protein